MLRTIKRFFRTFFRKTRNVNDEPINKVSLILIIIMDIFILSNVFMGLNDISNWYISPSQAYPCFSPWQSYVNSVAEDRDYIAITQEVSDRLSTDNLTTQYQRNSEDKIGSVSSICMTYASLKDKFYQRNYQQRFEAIEKDRASIRTIQQENTNIRQRYDSSLLEDIAGQPRELSINPVEARQARQTLEENQEKINDLEKQIDAQKEEIYNLPESQEFLSLLNSTGQFEMLERGFNRASFWYPSIQIIFQLLFLLPLIAIATWVHIGAEKRGDGQLALISWHLLVIFFIPLIIKIFEFLQVGALFSFVVDIISILFGGLLFLISYLYILIIPLITFALIKFCQKFIFNQKSQASKRIQNSKCLNCARKIPANAAYCPHCGYSQYVECDHCHNMTYKHLPYCIHCGTSQYIPPQAPTESATNNGQS